jgi:V/A-type H+-transporting ATPase subunit I
LSFPPQAETDLDGVVEPTELELLNLQLGEVWLQFSKIEEELRKLNEQYTALKQLLEMLQKFTALDVDLRIFQGQKHFLNLHIGTMPARSLEHLQEAMALAEHFITTFHTDENVAYVVVVGPLEHQEKVRPVLEHADFQPLTIPPQFQDHPQQVHADLTTQMEQVQQTIKAVLAKERALAEQQYAMLAQAYQTLNRAAAYAELTETSRKRGQLALIEGWIPQAELPKLEALLQSKLNRPFVLMTRQPTPAEYPQVPSVIRHHPLLASYLALVKNYGTPRYGEFDPTIWFAVTFVLMFGSMFGDVGHGALIAGAGWYWRDKLKTFTPFFLAAGISSLFFGFLYGSIFGFEKLLPALWMSPLHDPDLMLTIALYWGIGFILVATLITIVNRWQEGDYLKALFNNTGVAGICLYMGGFYAAKQWLSTNSFDTDQQVAVLFPLLLILGYKWHENQMPLAERLLVTLVEGLESVLNYLANTLSFLRVAAFSLNHVALAIAVFTLADMIGSPANWLIIILGNLLIVVLEGAIVTIQVLRLEYYEGFSRFFSGDGRAFRPLTKGMRLKGGVDSG